MKEKISVIIPIYNVEDYLEQCVESILNQTYTNLEIILVNDGSTDSSGEICDRYKNIDKRIKVIHKVNGGLSDARNCGLENSTGEYIAFFDSDDWADEKFYDTLYTNIKKYNGDIAVCNYKKYYSKKDIELHNSNEVICYSNIEALNQLYDKYSVQMIIACNKLYKRKVIGGIRFPVGKIHEDEYLIPMIIYNAYKIIYINNELFYYRQRDNSIMNKKFNIKRLDYLYALENRNRFFKDNNLDKLHNNGAEKYIYSIINIFFEVKKSNIKNKDEIKKQLKEKFKMAINENNKQNKIEFKIFIYSSSLYKFIYKDLIPMKYTIYRYIKSGIKRLC